MGWGDAFTSAYNAASSAAQSAATQAMSSAQAAADAVARTASAAAQAAARAAEATRNAAVAAAEKTRELAVAGATAARDGAVAAASVVRDGAVAVGKGAMAVGQGAANVAGFGVRAAGEAVGMGADAVTSAVSAPYRAARQVFAPAKPPAQTAVAPCPDSWAAKQARLEQRSQMIKDGRLSPDPADRAAAERLAANNEAVELARLSEDAYAQYPGGDFKYPDGSSPPPTGWQVVPAEELEAKGVSVEAMRDSRAVLYRSEPGWPGGQQTVLAFRGTADLPDGIVDHDQAMSQATQQYDSAMAAGRQVAQAYGPATQVTGHSLGGGKAQAAGAVSGLGGSMFNSAGLNPTTVDGMMPAADQFQQYRTTGDPLTGSQNSPATQTAIAAVAGVIAMPLGAGMKLGDGVQRAMGGQGLSPELADYADKAFMAFPRGVQNLVRDGNVLPPAIGPIHEVPAVGKDGQTISKLNLMGQHSITSAVNGIEQQKTDDITTLSTP